MRNSDNLKHLHILIIVVYIYLLYEELLHKKFLRGVVYE